ncbi:MAG: glycosyltransferase family 2 protein [Ilumatobacteraceae bacterium]|nr:glycosyltransferase family 2 protein [Ilumatobacteraceae bacterium]
MNLADTPLVRVVVLSFDGGQMTIDCIESLLASEWPAERMEIVLVDNGSLDDVADRVRADYPTVTLLEPLENLGFAGGCNLGMRLPGEHQFVALVNNDATVEPGWLRPLVIAAQSAPDIGAVSAKMLFADRYLGIEVSVPGAAKINRNDPRDLGVRVSAMRIDGVRADARVSFDEDFYGPELPNSEYEEEIARWSRARGSIRIAIEPGKPLPRVASLRLSSPHPRVVTLTTETETHTLDIGPERTWFDIRLGDEPFDVINNVGSNLYRNGFGGDRGFLQRDLGQYGQPAEVFAWCGGGVLLRRDYLDQVGLFDERLFLYYEDTDLSWRGRLQGWRYLYEPASVVHHRHAASSGVGSPVFRFYTERNRLLVLAKNAPARLAARAGLGEVRRFVRCMASAYILRPLRLQMPERHESTHRRKVVASYLRELPPMLRDRRCATPSVDRSSLMSWEVTK